jgi:hypothetical protein
MADAADSPCDVVACVSHGGCALRPGWCRVWRFVHGHDRSPANAAYLTEKMPARYVTVDTGGRVSVAPDAVRAPDAPDAAESQGVTDCNGLPSA